MILKSRRNQADAGASAFRSEGAMPTPLAAHPGRLLKRELEMRSLSASRLALDLGVPSGRITDILNGRRSITADTAVRLGRYFGNRAQFWLDLQSQYDIARIEREHGAEISLRVRKQSQQGAAFIRLSQVTTEGAVGAM
jgi:addiction module HigA family antidote